MMEKDIKKAKKSKKVVKQDQNTESSNLEVKKNVKDVFFEISKMEVSSEKIKNQNKAKLGKKEKLNDVSKEKMLVGDKLILETVGKKINRDDSKLIDSNYLKNNRNNNLKDETNFYIDIPYQSFNPVNILIKNHSPNNSTCDDNSNLKSLVQQLTPEIGNFNEISNERIVNKNLSCSNLKFKIEIQNLNQKVKEIKKVNKQINKTKISKNIENVLIKTYNELKESKFLGKKRSLDEKNLKIEKENSENFVFRKLTFNPEIIMDLAQYTNSDKIYTNNQINFINEQLSIYQKNTKEENNIENQGKDVKITSHNHNSNITNQDQIMNPFDKAIRNEFAQTLLFQKKFQEDYIPIRLQKENEDAVISKTHFIKKKQSALNIKRHCGVSYVIPTESKQSNISHKYK